MKPFVTALRTAFSSAADPSKAPAMEAYMKNKQKFRGINAVARKTAQNAVFGEYLGGLKDKSVWLASVADLWAGEWREDRYAALDLMDYGTRAALKHVTPEVLPTVVTMIKQCDHWDTLDTLATKILGTVLLQMSVEDRRTQIRALNAAEDHLWTRRAAILAQLKFKKATDTELLSEILLSRAHETDFFIRKAIGWSLREFAKTNKPWVREFVSRNADALSLLSKREALKHG
jgi:3-methyladenine DNA glycosylase AlkD